MEFVKNVYTKRSNHPCGYDIQKGYIFCNTLDSVVEDENDAVCNSFDATKYERLKSVSLCGTSFLIGWFCKVKMNLRWWQKYLLEKKPKRLEDTHPEVAGFIRGICHKSKPYGVKRILIKQDGKVLFRRYSAWHSIP